MLKRGIVGVVQAVGWHFKLSRVPLLKRTDELLFDHVDLLLALRKLHLAVLQLLKVVPINLLQVLHFAKQDQLFLVNDLLNLLLEHVVLPELFFALAHFSLFLFPVEALLECVDLSLVLVECVGDALDRGPLLLDTVAMVSNATFEGLPIGTRLELNESLLLVNSLTLLLDGLLKLLLSGICVRISIVLLFFGLGSGLLGLLGLILLSACRGCCSQLIFLHLAESIGVCSHLSLDRLNILLCLTVLHPDD